MTALLDVDDVTVAFGGLRAVDGVTVTIEEGRIHGVIGPNGAGKTTLFNAVSGLVKVSAGHIRFGGEDVTRVPPHGRSRLGIRRTFQSVQLIPQFTVLENVLIGLHERIREKWFPSLLSPSGRSAAEFEAQDRVMDILRFLGIEDTVLKRPSEMTFAEQRFVEIARALVARPRLLLLDEPAAGLSPAEVVDINGLLRRIRSDWGTTIVLVEHVLSLVLDVSDVVTVLDNGSVIAEGTPAAVADDPRVRTAYLGDDDA